MLIEDICHIYAYKEYSPTILSRIIENHERGSIPSITDAAMRVIAVNTDLACSAASILRNKKQRLLGKSR